MSSREQDRRGFLKLLGGVGIYAALPRLLAAQLAAPSFQYDEKGVGIVSAASGEGIPYPPGIEPPPRAISPGMLMTAYVSDATEGGTYPAVMLPLTTALGDTELLADGEPVKLLYASPAQINFAFPAKEAASLQVKRGDALSEGAAVISIGEAPTYFFYDLGLAVMTDENYQVYGYDNPLRTGDPGVLWLTGIRGFFDGEQVAPGEAPPIPADGPNPELYFSGRHIDKLIDGQPVAEASYEGSFPVDTPGLVGVAQEYLRWPGGNVLTTQYSRLFVPWVAGNGKTAGDGFGTTDGKRLAGIELIIRNTGTQEVVKPVTSVGGHYIVELPEGGENKMVVSYEPTAEFYGNEHPFTPEQLIAGRIGAHAVPYSFNEDTGESLQSEAAKYLKRRSNGEVSGPNIYDGGLLMVTLDDDSRWDDNPEWVDAVKRVIPIMNQPGYLPLLGGFKRRASDDDLANKNVLVFSLGPDNSGGKSQVIGGRNGRNSVHRITIDAQNYTDFADPGIVEALEAHEVGHSWMLHTPYGLMASGIDTSNVRAIEGRGGYAHPSQLQMMRAAAYNASFNPDNLRAPGQ